MATVKNFNYWTHRKPGATIQAAATRVRFFDDGVANGTGKFGNYNQLLLTGGALPDNRSGHVTGMFFSIINAGSVWTEGLQKLAVELINTADLILYVGGAEVQRGPIWAFCRPPEWAYGAATAATGFAQNGGYLLQTAVHPIQSLQVISVELVVPQTPSDMSTLCVGVTIQTLDSRSMGGA